MIKITKITHQSQNVSSTKQDKTLNIWNPWHGCIKISEGCANCYMYYLDAKYGKSGSEIYRTKTGFNYPLSRHKDGRYKIKSGEMIHVCLSSDFFLKQADEYRDEAWSIIKQRSDVKFSLLTKRIDRVSKCLPKDWDDGYENVMLSVSCENQQRADERIPTLLELPFKHKGIVCAPLIGAISIEKYLKSNQISLVLCDGENYEGARVCCYEWVKGLRNECERYNVTFVFYGTGRKFMKDGRVYTLENGLQRSQAQKSGLSFEGKSINFKLTDAFGLPIDEF
ncbi:hypothetical protein LMG7974_00017 [Campylobacter majalis]|uniref:DUF5131 family protein n=1 Tax=Campylobacter majalis TaxID=2790656 RepID=A0ABM8Q1L1_9BACT|nr:hypothetical protein LMG7974_00017 [Campylobacter majalis]